MRSTAPSAPPSGSAPRLGEAVALEHGVHGAELGQPPALRLAARRRDHPHAGGAGELQAGKADRGRRAAQQQRRSLRQVEVLERAGGGHERLGQRAQHVPRQRGVERDQLVLGYERVLGVAAVERAAHVSHERRDRLTRRHGGRVPVHRLHHADQLDPEDPRERHRVAGVALERLVLGPVESERLDPDQRPARTGLGPRHLAYDEPVRPVRPLRDHRSHLRHAPRRY
jgi:hypothetical protein